MHSSDSLELMRSKRETSSTVTARAPALPSLPHLVPDEPHMLLICDQRFCLTRGVTFSRKVFLDVARSRTHLVLDWTLTLPRTVGF